MLNDSSNIRSRLHKLYDRTHDVDQLLELLRAAFECDSVELSTGVSIDPTRPISLAIEMLAAMRIDLEEIDVEMLRAEPVTPKTKLAKVG